VATHQFSVSGQALTVDVELKVTLPGPKARGKRTPTEEVTVSAVYRVEYSLEPGVALADADVEAFARINSTYNVWPYWREFVQSATTRMGFPALTLPTLTVGRAVELAGYSTPSAGGAKPGT
jgi:preprotein translocase subunit SecB